MKEKRELQNIIEKITSIFIPHADGILLEGSSAWMRIRKGHDIDLEFFLPNFDFFRNLAFSNDLLGKLSEVVKEFTTYTLNYIVSIGLEMFSLKIFLDGQEISLRFTKSNLFNKICCLRLERMNRTKSLLQYRLYPTKPVDIQRNFSGEKINYSRWCFSLNGQQLIETLIVIIDERGKFYPGGVADRYLSFPKILYEKNSFCQHNLERLKINIVKRLMVEEKRNLHKSNSSLSLCLSRYERTPKRFLRQLEREEHKIRYKIEGDK